MNPTPGTFTVFAMALENLECPDGIYWDTWVERGEQTASSSHYDHHIERQAHRRIGPVWRRVVVAESSEWEETE